MTDFRHQWRAALTRDDSPASSTQRLVGLVVADYANKSGLAWPSVGTIAGRTGLGDKAVRVALHELVELEFLVVVRQGKGTTTTFQLIPNPGTTYRTTSVPGTDPPRYLSPLTPVPESKTPVRRTDEPLIRGKNLTVKNAPPDGARSSTVCQCGTQEGNHASWCKAAA